MLWAFSHYRVLDRGKIIEIDSGASSHLHTSAVHLLQNSIGQVCISRRRSRFAAVALIGYLVGRRKKKSPEAASTGEVQARRELKRAQAVAKELERIAVAVRRSLATHHSSVLKFKDRVSNLGDKQEDAPGKSCATKPRGC